MSSLSFASAASLRRRSLSVAARFSSISRFSSATSPSDFNFSASTNLSRSVRSMISARSCVTWWAAAAASRAVSSFVVIRSRSRFSCATDEPAPALTSCRSSSISILSCSSSSFVSFSLRSDVSTAVDVRTMSVRSCAIMV